MKKYPSLQFAGIIPSRYSSSRFPGKPLVLIGDKPMIQRVYEQASKTLDMVWVATDDKRIFDTVLNFGGKAVMTSPDHQSGTDRCAEAVEKINYEAEKKIDVVVNIQGDEPFIIPEQIDLLKDCFTDKSVELATLVCKIENVEDIFNPSETKVVINFKGDAIYFSRSAIPYIRDAEIGEWSKKHDFYKHVGLYAYRSETLKKITFLKRSPLEISESLEQNRWIENGYRVRTKVTTWESMGIDTPDDLKRAKLLSEHFF